MRVERGSGRFRVSRIFYKVNFLLGHLRSTDIMKNEMSRMNEKKYIGNSLRWLKWFVRKYEYGGSETADEISITADVRNSAEPTDVYERGYLTEIRNNEGDLQKVLGR